VRGEPHCANSVSFRKGAEHGVGFAATIVSMRTLCASCIAQKIAIRFPSLSVGGGSPDQGFLTISSAATLIAQSCFDDGENFVSLGLAL
jgi:hypothetical protein